MFYIPHTQPYYRQPEYNPYGYPPRRPISIYDDYEELDEYDNYVEAKRRGYLEALHQQQQHREYERAVALENQRHRAQLAALAEREVLRKRGSPHQTHPLYGYEQPQVQSSTLDEPVRRRQLAPKSQPQPRRHLDDWQTRLLEELYGIPAGHIHPQKEKERFDDEEVLELEEEHEPQTTRSARCPTHVVPTSKPQTHPLSQTAPKPQRQQPQSVRIRVTSPTNSDSESGSHERMQALTTVAEISHIFDMLRKTFTFPAGPLERDPHSSIPHLAYNAQNSVVYAYENALSELLTKLDAVESHGFKSVRDARKELVVQIEKELGELEQKVVQALGVGEEKGEEGKGEETKGEEQVERAVLEDVDMGGRPSVAPAGVSEAPALISSPPIRNLGTSANPNFRAIELASAPESIDTAHVIVVEEAPMTD